MDSTLNESVLKRLAITHWMADPRNRPVKLTSLNREPSFWVEGYITSYKYVAGRDLATAEQTLGLKPGELQGGAYFYEFQRLPEAHEFELRGYTQCPDGKPWTPESEYPAGSAAPQWQVRRNTHIPARLAAVIRPGGIVR